MDELKIVKFAELRSRMSGIPVKIILSFLIVAGAMCRFNFDRFKEDALEYVVAFFMMYGILAYFWLFIKLTGNWIIGIIAAFVPFLIWQYNMEKLGELWNNVIGAVVCFGGPAIDFVTVIRYFVLKKSLFSQMEASAGYEDYGDDEDVDEEYQRQQARREWQERQAQEQRKQEAASPGFFNGCKDTASIKRRYRDLCKVYHPDAGNGSSEVFNKITEEYNRLMQNT